jgi:hypothetical protein
MWDVNPYGRVEINGCLKGMYSIYPQSRRVSRVGKQRSIILAYLSTLKMEVVRSIEAAVKL